MKVRTLCFFVVPIAMTVWLGAGCSRSPSISASAEPGSGAPQDYQTLPGPGEKVQIDRDHSFTYGFVSPPKLGAAIMKVEVFDQEGKLDPSFTIKGDVDMPSMRGAHSAGERDFALSAKGTYLLPVQLVMPGDWEFRFNVVKDGTSVFHGAYLFDL